MQIYFTLLGGIAPALINLISVALAAASSNPTGTGEALMLLALFYIAIDAGNFGASRLILISEFSKKTNSLKLLDYVSGAISSAAFLAISYSAVTFGLITLDFAPTLVAVFPFLYCLSHSALGILRVKSCNGVIASILVFCAIIRLLVTFMHVSGHLTAEQFLLCLLIVEGLQGGLFFTCVKFILRRDPSPAFDRSVLETISRNKKMINASWFNNILNGLTKHSDVFLIGVLAGPSSVILYRPIKSAINLVFNVASSLSVVYISGSNLGRTKNLIKSRAFTAGLAIVFLSIIAFSLLVNSYWKILITDIVFENAFTVILASGISCVLVFFNRFLHAVTILLEANSALARASLIEISTLYSLFFILVPFFGVSGASFSILISSLMVFLYSAHNISRHFAANGNQTK